MAVKEHPLEAIQHYLPPGTAEDVIKWLHDYKIHLKIKRERKSILGDYRPAHQGKPHTISINANLNTFHFFITFLHELAHLINFLNHGRKVMPHGKEWKAVFALLLNKFHGKQIFPDDIQHALQNSMRDLSASTCSDPNLYKILRKYDEVTHTLMVEDMEIGDLFRTHEGRIFKILAKRRTRYECLDVKTAKKYLFPSIYEVYKEY